jgi:hypothetical protein
MLSGALDELSLAFTEELQYLVHARRDDHFVKKGEISLFFPLSIPEPKCEDGQEWRADRNDCSQWIDPSGAFLGQRALARNLRNLGKHQRQGVLSKDL